MINLLIQDEFLDLFFTSHILGQGTKLKMKIYKTKLLSFPLSWLQWLQKTKQQT